MEYGEETCFFLIFVLGSQCESTLNLKLKNGVKQAITLNFWPLKDETSAKLIPEIY